MKKKAKKFKANTAGRTQIKFVVKSDKLAILKYFNRGRGMEVPSVIMVEFTSKEQVSEFLDAIYAAANELENLNEDDVNKIGFRIEDKD